MTVATVDQIISRIKKASPFSRIAVFRLTRQERTLIKAELLATAKKIPRGELNAIFADSIIARKRVQNDPLLVGVYDNRDSASLTRNELLRHARKS